MNFQFLNFQKQKLIVLCAVSGVFLLILSLVTSLPNGKLLVVFCDVGQGDAIYIRTPRGADVLVDGGPDERVLNCLSRHMPFWDREIELAFLTHPQADHLNGLLAVLQRYKIDNFGIGIEGNESIGYKSLLDLLRKDNVKIFNPYLGQKISFNDEVSFNVLWPYSEWVTKQLGQGAVLGAKTSTDLNIFSTVLLLKYKNFDCLLMGDADSTIQDEILEDNNILSVDVLKVPHHGSKTALLDSFLNTVKPKLAVISVGRNSYGHPAGELVERLKAFGVMVLRTDEKNGVEVTSDGATWSSN